MFEAERKRRRNDSGLGKHQARENPVRLWRELGELMTRYCTVIATANLQRRPMPKSSICSNA